MEPDRASFSIPSPNPEDTFARVRRTYERHFGAGEVIFEPGESGEVLYVIESGEVELSRPGPDGPRPVARLGPGDFFGEMSVLLRAPRGVRATARRDVRAIELDGETFRAMCLERPEIALRIIQRLVARVLELQRRLAALGGDDVLRPLVRTLLRRARPDRHGARVEARLRELAEEAGLGMLEAYQGIRALFERRLLRIAEDTLLLASREELASVLDAPPESGSGSV